jgi:DNA-binding GntR family transcriptional regulator
MVVDPPAHTQLRNVVAEQLRTAIREGKYKPGEWLRQERLAQELGVSQMPVREALKQLATEGLIEHMPYRGAKVISFSIEDIEDLYTHRAFLEGRAAYFAAKILSSEELNIIKGIQADILENNEPKDLHIYRELNRKFHQTIYSICGREYLIRSLNQMWATFPTMLLANFSATASHPLPERERVDVDEHNLIISALEARNPDLAEEKMREHIMITARHLMDFLQSNMSK